MTERDWVEVVGVGIVVVLTGWGTGANEAIWRWLCRIMRG